MYKMHEHFETVPDDTIIWRYMDLPKFLYLIKKNELYFCRGDKFGDIFEGSLPLKNKEKNIMAGNKILTQCPEAGGAFLKALPQITQQARNCTFVNCWHMNEYESAAMWTMYSEQNSGIAIKSSFKKLKNSFNLYEQEAVYIGKVSYIDYIKDEISDGNMFVPILFKRKSYEHEKELRVAIRRDNYINCPKESLPLGINVTTNIEELIEQVYVAPGMPGWQKEIIDKILTDKKLNESKRSDLDKDPIF